MGRLYCLENGKFSPFGAVSTALITETGVLVLFEEAADWNDPIRRVRQANTGSGMNSGRSTPEKQSGRPLQGGRSFD